VFLRTSIYLSCITALGYGPLAHGQDAQPASTINSFQVDYFDQYTPRSALDMIEQIPGFQLQTSASKRGLGQGGANVLLNGERISGKTRANDQLSRINATTVVRIDIVDGASLDIPGLSGRVANIITKNTDISGTWAWRPRFRKNLAPNWFNGSATVSGETGKLAYSATVRNNAFRSGNAGLENRFTPDGFIFETRDEVSRFDADNPGISTSLTWKPKNGHVANLNAEYNLRNFTIREISRHTAFALPGDNNETQFSSVVDSWNYSLGGDYEFPAGPQALNGKLKLIGYHKFTNAPSVSQIDTFTAGAQSSGQQFGRDTERGESIARAEYSFAPKRGKDWQLSVEGAFNFTDATSTFAFLNLASGEYVAIPLPGGSSRVEEKRSEVTLTHSRALSPKWDIQLSAGGEYSQLSQSGDANLVQDFVRPKGFITTTYKPGNGLSIRTRIEREVGQLNFSDFLASLSLQEDLDSAANDGLVPAQTWLGSVEFDKDFGQGNTFKVKVYGELISDLVDRIPVVIDGVLRDAVGNIDKAQRYGVDFTATLKGDKWDLKGTQLNLSLDLRNSSVDDPLTNISRRLNNDRKSKWNVNFRHDIPNTDLAYGASLDYNVPAPSFRLDTISTESNTRPLAIVYVEHKDIYGLKVRAGLRNILNQTDNRLRQEFTTSRDIGQLEFTESRTRPFGTSFRLDVSGAF